MNIVTATGHVSATTKVHQKFSKIFWESWHRQGRTPRVGIAVSGGVDSMALATLCHDYARRNPKNTPTFTAFIVNHGLRPGSDTEAVEVTRTLNRLNIDAKVLPLDWESTHLNVVGTGTPSNLETKARELRYRTLGQACYAANIPSLLIAHHAEDQAETVLVRVATGYTGFGLRGMLPVAYIPDCHDLVDERSGPSGAHSQPHRIGQAVKVERPLLPFHKEELIDICREAGVRWFEDHTNLDPSLTVRNTIRYMLRRNLLPTALGTDRLCKVAELVGKEEQLVESKADALLQKLPLEMNTGFGTLTCTIDPRAIREIANDETEVGRIQATLLRRIICLVSPKASIALANLHVPMKHVYSRDNGSAEATKHGVSIAGVQIYVERSANRDGPRTLHIARANPHSDNHSEHALRVRLPRSSHSRPHVGDAATSTILTPQESPSSKPLWSRWRLFDNRFWIRIGRIAPPPGISPRSATEPTAFRIRFLREEDFWSKSELHDARFFSAIRDHSASWGRSLAGPPPHYSPQGMPKSEPVVQVGRENKSPGIALAALRTQQAPLQSLPVIEALHTGPSSLDPEQQKEGDGEELSSTIVALPSLGWGRRAQGHGLSWREWQSPDSSSTSNSPLAAPTNTAPGHDMEEISRLGSWVFECRYRLAEELEPTEDRHAIKSLPYGIIARNISGEYPPQDAPASADGLGQINATPADGCLMARFLQRRIRLPQDERPDSEAGISPGARARRRKARPVAGKPAADQGQPSKMTQHVLTKYPWEMRKGTQRREGPMSSDKGKSLIRKIFTERRDIDRGAEKNQKL